MSNKQERQFEFNNAVRKVNVKQVTAFLKDGSYKRLLNEPNAHGMTPLHELCVRTTLDPNDAYTIAKLLIDNGAKESLKVIDDEGYQPVHYAAAAGYEAVVRLFVENGAVLDVASNLKFTPLHCAASSGNLDLVKYLVTQKCDINALNEFSATPSIQAACNGHTPVVEYLDSLVK